MIKKYFALMLSLLSFSFIQAEGYTTSNDTIPECDGNYLFDSYNFKISLYEYDSIIQYKKDLGYFNWGPSSGNFAMINNMYEDSSLSLIGFDTAGYLVYSRPFAENGWFASTQTPIKFTSYYKTLAAYDELIYIYQSNRLFKYRLGGDLVLLRTDAAMGMSQQVVDEDFNYVYLSDDPSQGFRADAVQIVDSAGIINYRFVFTPSLNTYNMQSMFMMNDSLFVITGSLNQTYKRSLIYIKLDYATYTAQPIPLYSSGALGDLIHIVSCSPGKIAEGCVPNVHIEPDITSLEEEAVRSLQVYPNPVSNELNIILASTQPVNFDIYDSQAQLVRNGIVDGNSGPIDVSALSSGIYFIRLTNIRNSAFPVVEKFIKLD
jgi:hypothetical protein